jgi:hypothetical protein
MCMATTEVGVRCLARARQRVPRNVVANETREHPTGLREPWMFREHCPAKSRRVLLPLACSARVKQSEWPYHSSGMKPEKRKEKGKTIKVAMECTREVIQCHDENGLEKVGIVSTDAEAWFVVNK